MAVALQSKFEKYFSEDIIQELLRIFDLFVTTVIERTAVNEFRDLFFAFSLGWNLLRGKVTPWILSKNRQTFNFCGFLQAIHGVNFTESVCSHPVNAIKCPPNYHLLWLFQMIHGVTKQNNLPEIGTDWRSIKKLIVKSEAGQKIFNLWVSNFVKKNEIPVWRSIKTLYLFGYFQFIEQWKNKNG